MSTSTSAPTPPRRKRRDTVTRRRFLDGASLLSLLAALMLIFATGIYGARGVRDPEVVRAGVALFSTPTPSPTATPMPTATPIPTSTPTPEPTATATPSPPLVAIVAGHRNNDSGAICEGGPYEGLQEVQITTQVTTRLKGMLEGKGYQVMDLDEFDGRLNGLRADMLLSIHVDSCVDWEGTTGFKAARSVLSSIPEQEDRLVQCLVEEYGRSTRLPVHPGSITHNMTNYHAFRRIDSQTPAAIIELGFLYYDHDLLVNRQDLMVEGLMRSVDCFLR